MTAKNKRFGFVKEMSLVYNYTMKTIYLYVPNTMADWEVGQAIAELNSQRFFAERKDWLVKTFSLTKKPVVTMGGISRCRNDFPFSTYSLPEFPVIKLAAIGVTGGVVNILHIDKNGDIFHDNVLLA